MVFVFRPDQGTSAIAGPTTQGSLDPRSARPIFTRSGTKVDVPVNAAVRYRLVAAGPPSVVAGNEVRLSPEAALQVESLLRNPGERVMARVRELERQEASRSELRQQIDSTITFGTLPVDMTLHEFYSPEELSLNLAWHWPQDQLQFESYQGGRLAKTDLMVQVLDAEGRTVD